MACITTVPPSIILSLHQINLRHVRVSAIMMPLGRHLQRRGPSQLHMLTKSPDIVHYSRAGEPGEGGRGNITHVRT